MNANFTQKKFAIRGFFPINVKLYIPFLVYTIEFLTRDLVADNGIIISRNIKSKMTRSTTYIICPKFPKKGKEYIDLFYV